MFGLQKPLTERLHQKMIREVDGEHFAGSAVAIAPYGDFETEPEIAAPTHDLLTRLANLPLEDRKAKEQRDELRAALYATIMEVQEFINEVIASRNAILENQLEEIRTRGRAQQKILNGLEQDRQEKEFQFHSARVHADNCLMQLKDLRTTRMSRWASKADRAALGKKITAAELDVREANSECVKATDTHNSAAEDVAAASQRMGEISNFEIRLRGELSGKVFKDPETGLPILPV
jgi:chromosome segregation ATPase